MRRACEKPKRWKIPELGHCLLSLPSPMCPRFNPSGGVVDSHSTFDQLSAHFRTIAERFEVHCGEAVGMALDRHPVANVLRAYARR